MAMGGDTKSLIIPRILKRSELSLGLQMVWNEIASIQLKQGPSGLAAQVLKVTYLYLLSKKKK